MGHISNLFLIILGLSGTAYFGNYYSELSSTNVCVMEARCLVVITERKGDDKGDDDDDNAKKSDDDDDRVYCPTRLCKGEMTCCQFCLVNSTAVTREVTFAWRLLLPEPSPTLIFIFWVLVGVLGLGLLITTFWRVKNRKRRRNGSLCFARLFTTFCLLFLMILLSVGLVYVIGSLVIDWDYYRRCKSALTISVGWAVILTSFLLHFLLFLWPAIHRRGKRARQYDRLTKSLNCDDDEEEDINVPGGGGGGGLETSPTEAGTGSLSSSSSSTRAALKILIKERRDEEGASAAGSKCFFFCLRQPFRVLDKLLVTASVLWWLSMGVYLYVLENKRRLMPF
jgi:hypothetical protein